MNLHREHAQLITRRHFFHRCNSGIGALALASLLGGGDIARAAEAANPVAANPLAPKLPPMRAKAKRVIYLHMSGSPPHLDLFDYKPELVKRTGQDVPESHLKGKRFAFTSGVPKLLGTPRKFKQHG
ncbi:MAG: DUF1501 domain-containing protein, partial [Tepidisphaeraceae bacterium]